MRAPDDPAGFIRSNTRLLPVPHAPETRLHVADEATDLWQRTEEELQAIGLPPPFWAFAWAGGQALARYVLDNPDVADGARVVDFASGSGLVYSCIALGEPASASATRIPNTYGVTNTITRDCIRSPLEIGAMSVHGPLNVSAGMDTSILGVDPAVVPWYIAMSSRSVVGSYTEA